MPGEGSESLLPPQAPVEQLVSFLNVQMGLADQIHDLEIDIRFSSGSSVVDGNPQFIDTGESNPYIRTPHERIMLRSPDEVEAGQAGFIRRNAEGKSPWDSATFHVVRPILIEDSRLYNEEPVQLTLDGDIFYAPESGEGNDAEDDENDDTPLGINIVRPDRFVIYIEMKDGADLCYIAHPSPDTLDFVLEEFDIEIFDRSMDERIDIALSELLSEIAAEEGDDADEADPDTVDWAYGDSVPTQPRYDNELRVLHMEAFTLELTSFMRARTVLHPFRAAN